MVMSHGKALQKQLEEDLATLLDILVQPGPLPPRHVRSVGSAIVRKWLVEGKLNDLGHDIGVKFELPAYDTSPVFSVLPNTPEIKIYISGGINLGGVPIRSMYVSSSPYNGEMPIPAETESVLYSPGKFLGSKRVYFKGHTFTAEQIITFVANKHGGIHFDQNREKPWQVHLETASSYMIFGNPSHEKEPSIIDLEGPEGACLVVIPSEVGNTWSCLEIEMLAAAQALVNVHVNGTRLILTTNKTDDAKPWWKIW